MALAGSLTGVRSLHVGHCTETRRPTACTVVVHTATDGDTIFAVAAGDARRTARISLLGAHGAEVTVRALLRAARAVTRLRCRRPP